METVHALSTVLNKVAPLQEEKKLKEEQLLKQLKKLPPEQQTVEHDGRIYKLVQSASKPSLSQKFLKQMINKFNSEYAEAVPDNFIEFLRSEQDTRKKPPKARLSVKKA